MKNTEGLEFVHGDLYGVAMNLLKKWVSQNNMRPMLHYADHMENGDIVATDNHRMIWIKGIHGFKERYLVDPKTFNFAKGDYPDVTNLSTLNEYKEALVLSKEHTKLWLQLFKSLNQTLRIMKDNSGNVTMHFKEERVEVELMGYKIFLQLPHDAYQKPDMDAISMRVQYMRDALEAHSKLESEQVAIFLKHPLQPVILDDNNSVRTLILPVRTY